MMKKVLLAATLLLFALPVLASPWCPSCPDYDPDYYPGKVYPTYPVKHHTKHHRRHS